ncbi:uncharacterized protein LOC119951320 isoform X2 [Scyliorhinus canicula]|uniref:uncharacterized protein LOC119951320 isoform X2 n=1 Tax=Scyliorhinus canicula TaxID=7830 RepID=UPI0018F683B9|nr:uncharacterized protein LOC119951320 isoform X2 [Scyliorhinus canicula]
MCGKGFTESSHLLPWFRAPRRGTEVCLITVFRVRKNNGESWKRAVKSEIGVKLGFGADRGYWKWRIVKCHSIHQNLNFSSIWVWKVKETAEPTAEFWRLQSVAWKDGMLSFDLPLSFIGTVQEVEGRIYRCESQIKHHARVRVCQ